jgi:hypothetical protein
MAYSIKKFEGKRKNGTYKEGQLVAQKIINGNEGRYAIKLYYYKDGYRIYAWKEVSPNNIIESKAVNYPIGSLDKALKEVNDYKNERDVLILHPALRSK